MSTLRCAKRLITLALPIMCIGRPVIDAPGGSDMAAEPVGIPDGGGPVLCSKDTTAGYGPKICDCMLALVKMPSFSEQEIFQYTPNRRHISSAFGNKWYITVGTLEGGEMTSWLYVQTLAMQLLPSCGFNGRAADEILGGHEQHMYIKIAKMDRWREASGFGRDCHFACGSFREHEKTRAGRVGR